MNITERTVVLVKPDVLQRGILGRIIQRLEDAGLKVVASRMVNVSPKTAKKHYSKSKEWKVNIGKKVVEEFHRNNIDPKKVLGTNDPLKLGERVYHWSIEYLTKAPLLALLVEGPHAIDRAKKVIGPTNPTEAPKGTIRGDFSVDSIITANFEKRAVHNLVHRSSNKAEAKHETALWFKPSEIVSYNTAYEIVTK